MKKITKLLGKTRADVTEFNEETISGLLKKHGELDVIVRGGQRYFIAPHMHENGKIEQLGNSFNVLTKDGDKLQITYSDIVGVEF